MSTYKTKYNRSHDFKSVAMLVCFFIFFISCEDFIEVDPPKTQLTDKVVFSSDASATSVLMGIYGRMITVNGFAGGGGNSLTHLNGLSADELINYSTSSGRLEFYNNALSAANSTIKNLWEEPYRYIYAANAIIEGVHNSSNVTSSAKSQLEGEAKFVRAFCYFYLANTFGDVPLVISTDYRINPQGYRTPKSQIFDQIVSDLTEAQDLLNDDYISVERVRPNKSAATALLARVYLYTKDWVNAQAQATLVINKNSMYWLESDLGNVFLANSSEAIWQLIPPSGYTFEGNSFILTSGPSPSTLSNQLLSSFEPDDKRLTNWVNSITVSGKTYYYPYKYKIKSTSTFSEYSMVLRFAEQYLIRAEALARQDKLSEAIDDLDMIRQRAGLPLIKNTSPDISQDDLILAIEQERKVELFSEWGHRWNDLKRWDLSDQILQPLKPSWQSTDALYPIPQTEITNGRLSQNEGYQ